MTPYHRAMLSVSKWLISAVLCSIALVAQGQWLADYCYRKTVSIQPSEVSGSEDLTDFPVLFSLTDNDLRYVGFGGNVSQFEGHDIRITNANHMELDIELKYYSPETGEITLWAKVPSIDSDQETVLFLYYGNGAAGAYATPEATWESSFGAVWHLDEPTDAQVLDATANNMDETVDGMGRPYTATYGANTTTTSIEGVIGPARSFNNSGNNAADFGYIEIPHAVDNPLDITGNQITVEVWARMYFPAPSDSPFVIKGRGTNQESYMLGVDGGTNEINRRITSSTANGIHGYSFNDICNSSGHFRYDDPADVDAGWHYYVLVYDGSNNDPSVADNLKTFFDGGLIPFDKSATCATPYPYGNLTSSDGGSFEDLFIGRRIGSNRMFKGAMDEVRISNTARSDGWITTTYNNIHSPSTFYLVGEEEYPLAPGIVSVPRSNLDEGESATITADGVDPDADLQWQQSVDNATFTNISGEDEAALIVPSLSSTTYYRLRSTKAGCEAFSNVLTLTVRKAAFLGEYLYRSLLSVDHTLVQCTNTLNDFPLLISFSGKTALRTASGKVRSADGYDIVFTDISNNLLDHDLEYYDGANGDLVAWVKVDLMCNAATELFMYYGDCTPSIDDPSEPGTWSNEYAGVYHLNEDPSGQTVTDVSGNDNDGVATGFNSDSRISGQIGQAIALDGINDYVDFGTDPQLTGSASRTYETWMHILDFSNNDGIFQAGPPGGNDFSLHVLNNNDNNFEVERDGFDDDFTLNAALDNWRQVALVYDEVASETLIYYDGELFNTFSGSINTGSDDLELGRYNNQEFEGYMDEFRVSSVARSADWIKTQYLNQSDPAAFFQINFEQSNFQWTGAEDTDWGNINNWSSCFIPNPSDDVTIPSGLPRYPILDADRTVSYLRIDPGASLNLGAHLLTIEGDFNNSGSLIAAGGAVSMAGERDQYLRGMAITEFFDLEIDKTSGDLLLSEDVHVESVLTLSQGLFVLNGQELSIAPSGEIVGGSSTSYIVAAETSCLTQEGLGIGGRTGDILFPVGTRASSYTPATINNWGTADDFCIYVCDNVYEDGSCSGVQIVSSVVNKTWNITPVNGVNLDVTIALQWNSQDEGPLFDRTDGAFISRFGGSAWGPEYSEPVTGSDPYVISATGLSSFSPFALASGSGPLPVEYGKLEARLVEDRVVLEWTTVTEMNNDHFEVERSGDGVAFDKIGVVSGLGNSSVLAAYQFVDHQPLNGLSYYRLRQVDYDGSSELSRTMVVAFTGQSEKVVSIFPNPASTELTIKSLMEAPIRWLMIDPGGRVLEQREVVSEREVKLPISRLPRGKYFFVFESELTKQVEAIILR